MVLKTFQLDRAPVPVRPLTLESFSKFGSIVSPDEEISARSLKRAANYGTAIKLRELSLVDNKFTGESKTNINLFRCYPPRHLMTATAGGFDYLGKVLERHPYSSQTFIPMGRASGQPGYIVACASNDPDGLPDPSTIEAFFCHANQAVTYAAGTWHAPMIALGADSDDYIDFSVVINENGVDEDDVQECYFEPGFVLQFQA